MALTVAVLETLFTANVKDFEKKADQVDKAGQKIEKSNPTAKVGAETKGALADLVKVETSAKKITSTKVVSQVDADISKAQKAATKIETSLKVLASLDTTPEVSADIAKAQKSLDKVETRLTALRGARAEMVVVADVKKAEKSLDDVAGKAGKAGAKGGQDAGRGLSAGIIAALATIPIAGAVVGIGAAIGKSLMDGLDVEVRSDTLMAKTGLDAKSTAIIARAAGEAYASNWGESLAANMATAKNAIQGGLLDPKGTARDSQAIIESLSGVADIMEEDIPRVSRSAAQAIRTGLAKDAAGAFDLMVRGTQAGLNVSEDLLDTIDEYGTQFRVLGLDGPQAFGLLSQAIKGGARDTDTAADSLKEFAIRAVDGSELTAESYKAIGLSAEDMAAKVIKGGPTSAAALELTLDKLRQMEPGAARTAAAVGLFGTKAEDLGDALYAMDLSTAVAQLGQVEGAAQSAMDTLGDNAAGSIASAQRNIEIAGDGIKGALASAFNPQIEGFATFVSENRSEVMQFLYDMASGGIDAARAMVNGAADMTSALGVFLAGSGADLIQWIGDTVLGIDAMLPGDQGGREFARWANGAAGNLRKVGADAVLAGEDIRKNFIEDGLDPAQAKLDAVALPMIAQAALHDASVSLAKSIDQIGYAGDGSKLKLDNFSTTINLGSKAGQDLDAQLRTMVESLDAESAAAAEADETQEQLNTRYIEGRQALKDSLIQMGYTAEQAKVLADRYGAIPKNVATKVSAPGTTTASGNVQVLHDKLYSIPQNRGVLVTADTDKATQRIAAFKKALEMPDVVITAAMRDNPYYKNRALGGSIIGPGTGTSDDIPAMLSNGEHVLTASDVQKAGGQDGVYRLRQAIQDGGVRFATGGGVYRSKIDVDLSRVAAVSGGGGSTGATSAGSAAVLVQYARMIKAMGGYSVGEHPLFGGVTAGGHMRGSKHYRGAAIDINAGAGTSVAEQRKLARIMPLAKSMGLGTIFMVDGHRGHAHVEAMKNGGAVGRVRPIARASGGAVARSVWRPPSASTASPVAPAAAPSLAGLAIEGTLDLGNGLVGMLHGVVKSELAATGARARYAGRS